MIVEKEGKGDPKQTGTKNKDIIQNNFPQVTGALTLNIKNAKKPDPEWSVSKPISKSYWILKINKESVRRAKGQDTDKKGKRRLAWFLHSHTQYEKMGGQQLQPSSLRAAVTLGLEFIPMSQLFSWKLLQSYSSNFSEHVNHIGNVWKCRIWFSRSRLKKSLLF